MERKTRTRIRQSSLFSLFFLLYLPTQYKKKPPPSSGMSIDSLVHPTASISSFPTLAPTPYNFASFSSVLVPPPSRPTRKPSVNMYFSGQVPSKRPRDDEQDVDARDDSAKRLQMISPDQGQGLSR